MKPVLLELLKEFLLDLLKSDIDKLLYKQQLKLESELHAKVEEIFEKGLSEEKLATEVWVSNRYVHTDDVDDLVQEQVSDILKEAKVEVIW